MAVLRYTKQPLSIVDLVARLESRGMLVADRAQAAAYLKQTGYYRFSGYAYPFRQIDFDGNRLERFVEGTRFEQIVEVAEFDWQLCRILNSGLSVIEVAFRASVCQHAAITTGSAFWHTDGANFLRAEQFQRFADKCEQAILESSGEAFIRHFKNKYPVDPVPCWAMMEILSWGSVCAAFNNLASPVIRNSVARDLGCHPNEAGSWIKALSDLRNKCAHQSRVWNRSFMSPPRLTQAMKATTSDSRKIFILIVIITRILAHLGNERLFSEPLSDLYDRYQHIDWQAMGMLNVPND